jgi:hypothetical protein
MILPISVAVNPSHSARNRSSRSRGASAARGDAGNVLSEQRLEAFPSRVYLGHIDLLAASYALMLSMSTPATNVSASLAMNRALDDAAVKPFYRPCYRTERTSENWEGVKSLVQAR